MTPTARPVRNTLLGSVLGAACGAALYFSPMPTAPIQAAHLKTEAGAWRPLLQDSATRSDQDTDDPLAGVTAAWIHPPAASATPTRPANGSQPQAQEQTASAAPAPVIPEPKPKPPSLVETLAGFVTAAGTAESGAAAPLLRAAGHDPLRADQKAATLVAEALPLEGLGDSLAAATHPAAQAGARTPTEDLLMDAPVDLAREDAVAVSASVDPAAMDTASHSGASDSAEPVHLALTVSSGDTLMGLLLEQDIPRKDAFAAIEALRPVFDPRNIRPGVTLDVTLRPALGNTVTFEGLQFEPAVGTTVALARDEAGSFAAEKQAAPMVHHVVRHDGVIESSLFEAGAKAGASNRALAELIRIFSYDVDFQRDVRKGDQFEVFYEQVYTEDGRLVRTGDILYAGMTLSGDTVSLYRFEDADGFVNYYNEKGEGVRKALLRTPINGARLSSGFGMRRHPILGYSKMHKGVDFAAPTGTPIYAAGDGIVERANRFGGYGNYVRIRHNGSYKTAYGHMSRFGKGIGAGKRVKQGQVIGYVGSTGRSTGAHLHYEILKDDQHVNPMKVRFPSGKTLEGSDLAAFQQERDRITLAFQNTPSGTKLASAR